MIIFIIAGGSGTRLWPLSTSNYPKHLLSLTNEKSLLQNTVDRALETTSRDNVYIITEKSHSETVEREIEGVSKENIIVEPTRRGTASCYLLAFSIVEKLGKENEPLLFLCADHLVRDVEGFVASMLKAGEIASEEGRLVFIGVEPTYPSTGLGYMERGELLNGWQQTYNLVRFKEKPDKKVAEQYLSSGRFFWNTGYMVGQLSTFKNQMALHSARLLADYSDLIKAKDVDSLYMDFISEPIDTALSEKVQDGIVIPGTFDWADVGSFKDLHEISLQDATGNHIRGERVEIDDSSNCYVRNETDVPVAVIGLDNVVVVNTPNGVLVTNKNYAQKVGDIAKRLQK